jgi:hypothetical protein
MPRTQPEVRAPGRFSRGTHPFPFAIDEYLKLGASSAGDFGN